MCLFPLPNLNYNSPSYKKGVTSFPCGSCPECNQVKSSHWALRASYEAKTCLHACMITLTYDQWSNKSRTAECPVDGSLHVNKRDIQLFIKRLRAKISPVKIKYLCCAEYGSRTHRAHYHLLIFGYDFPDRHYYKRSKRGNSIYISPELLKIWDRGICTVDCVNVRPAVARYCTKYCAKSRGNDDTFMLFSRNIGRDGLIRDFNGLYYMLEGRYYPIPRQIWENYIVNKYCDMDINPAYCTRDRETSLCNSKRRKAYYNVRDCDELYRSYLAFWAHRVEQSDRHRGSVMTRIALLDDGKYAHYKSAAVRCLIKRSKQNDLDEYFPAPLSGCKALYCRSLEKVRRRWFPPIWRCPSRPATPNDRIFDIRCLYFRKLRVFVASDDDFSVFS